VCTFFSTAFAIAYSFLERDHFGMIYGMVLHRMLMSVLSYQISPKRRPRLRVDARVARDLFGFSKFVIPSSLISLVLTQFDKVVFLKLFDLHLLGLYGIAANIALPVDTLTSQISRHVLLARCSDIFRSAPESLRFRYYRDNVKLFMLVMLIPAAVAGSSRFLVDLLYDDRYTYAAVILQAFMLRSILLSLSGPAENLLVATGGGRIVLAGNLFRIGFLPAGALLGYLAGGFEGFLLGIVLSEAPVLGYFWWRQKTQNLLIVRYEFIKLAFIGGVFTMSFAIATQFSGFAFALRRFLHE
jgi:O-antigen/teichoic acid export membrane protein